MNESEVAFELALARHALSAANQAREEFARTGDLRKFRATMERWPNNSVPIIGEGLSQIRALRITLNSMFPKRDGQKHIFDAYIASELPRTIQTGMCVYVHAPWTQDARLNEQEAGELSLMNPRSEPVKKWQADKKKDALTAVPPDGESVLDVIRRVDPLAKEWLSPANHGKRFLAVGHSRTNLILLAILAGMPPHELRQLNINRPRWTHIANCDFIQFVVLRTGKARCRIVRPTLSGNPIDMSPWIEIPTVGLHPDFEPLIAQK